MKELLDYRAAFTPAAIADRMVQMAEIQEGMIILDPCAGEGAIAYAIDRVFPKASWPNTVAIEVIEINTDYHLELYRTGRFNNIGNLAGLTKDERNNFLKLDGRVFVAQYDRVLMNPPFEDELWAEFLNKSYNLLKPGGILVSIIPWSLSSPKLGDFMKGKRSELQTHIDNWVKREDGKPSKWKIAILKVWKDG